MVHNSSYEGPRGVYARSELSGKPSEIFQSVRPSDCAGVGTEKY